MDAYKILGVTEGSVRDKAALEKVRQRSKDLYKRYAAEKKESQAKRVLEAFEVIKAKYKKQEGGKQATPKEPSASPTASSSSKPAVSSSSSKPSAAQAPNASQTRPSAGTNATGVAQRAVEIQKDLASLRRQFNDVAESKADLAKGSNQTRKPSSSGDKSHRSTTATSGEKSHRSATAHGRPSADKKSGTSTTIRTSASGVISLSAQKAPSGTTSNGDKTHKRKHSSLKNGDKDSIFTSIKSAATVVQPQIDVDKKVGLAGRLICSCGASYGAARFEGASGSFVCPACRVRAMDPLNVVLKGSKGLLNLKLVQRPLVPEDAKLEANFKFKLDLPDVKEWRKSGDNVEARMCRLDTYDVRQAWPQTLGFKINGKQAFAIKEPKPGHKRRELPQKIGAHLKRGVNVLEISMKDQNVQRYALALVRTTPQIPRAICKHVKLIGVEDCKQRVKDLMFSSMLDGCVEEFQAAASDRSRLICPITLARIRTPARGKKCRHLQCFDLEAYLVANLRMAAFNKRWHCPVCDLVTKPPGDMFIDTFVVQILAETGELDEEVAFDSTCGWTVSAVAASPASDSEDGYIPPTSNQKEDEDELAIIKHDEGNISDSDVDVCEPEPDGVDEDDKENGENGHEKSEKEAETIEKEDREDEDKADEAEADVRTASPKDEEPRLASGSPEASGEYGDWGENASESVSSEADCQTDPYMLAMRDDDDIDEDFAASLQATSNTQEDDDNIGTSKSFEDVVNSLSTRYSGRTVSLRSMVATPAPLASPSPGEASDPDDPLGVSKGSPARKKRRILSRSRTNDDDDFSGAEADNLMVLS